MGSRYKGFLQASVLATLTYALQEKEEERERKGKNKRKGRGRGREWETGRDRVSYLNIFKR